MFNRLLRLLRRLVFTVFPPPLIEYVFFTRNHLMQILYVILIGVGYVAYTMTAYRYQHLHDLGVSNLPYYILLFNIMFFFCASHRDPGVITTKNVDKATQRFAYDGLMYGTNVECKTCK